MMTSKSTRRVVVTGIGAITPLGLDLATSWNALIANESGMTTLEEALEHQGLSSEALQREIETTSSLSCRVAAPVKGVERDTRTARFVQFALLAGLEAMEHAQLNGYLKANPSACERSGVSIGSGMSCVREVVESAQIVQSKGLRRLSPHFVPKVLINSAASRLSLQYGLRGPNHAVSTACAAGAHAIGDASRYIKYGDADIMLAGGTEAAIDPISLGGFSRLRALTTNPDIHAASKPFDIARDGFIMGEGAAVLVLEELEHAQARNVPILAELLGYGITGDAYHITSPDPVGAGAARAMKSALEGSNLKASQIAFINAHATSTPKGDEIEAQAIDSVFDSSFLKVSSTKGATGHLLGAAGAVEAAFTIQSLLKKIIPHTRNLETVSEFSKFKHVLGTSANFVHSSNVYAMTNSFGFGGTNASLIFGEFQEE
mmetsp:Transcript_18527/g.28003  ORF Transcript_18527/g.28003 Transcript_18527/m.28003 type:complete len:432 (+) Transcript_18527:188-1483(+)